MFIMRIVVHVHFDFPLDPFSTVFRMAMRRPLPDSFLRVSEQWLPSHRPNITISLFKSRIVIAPSKPFESPSNVYSVEHLSTIE